MKKAFIILFLIFLIFISGCNNNDLSVKLFSYSDSIPGVKHVSEFDLWSGGTYFDNDETKHVLLETKLGPIEGEYLGSRVRLFEYFTTKEYKDSNNDTFEIAENGNICSYFWGRSNQIKTDQITKEECLEIANSFLSNFVNVTDYSINVELKEGVDMYVISYNKYINEIKTADQAIIEVDRNGNLYSFYSTLLGQIPNDTILEYDMDRINNMVIERLDDEYKGIKKEFDLIRYKNVDNTLAMINEKTFVIVCTVDVECVNLFDDNGESVMGERLQFVIE